MSMQYEVSQDESLSDDVIPEMVSLRGFTCQDTFVILSTFVNNLLWFRCAILGPSNQHTEISKTLVL